MTVEKVLFTLKARTTGSWKNIFMKHSLLRLVFVTLLPRRRRQMQPGHKCKWPLLFPASLEKSGRLQEAHSTFKRLQAWSILMSNSPNNL